MEKLPPTVVVTPCRQRTGHRRRAAGCRQDGCAKRHCRRSRRRCPMPTIAAAATVPITAPVVAAPPSLAGVVPPRGWELPMRWPTAPEPRCNRRWPGPCSPPPATSSGVESAVRAPYRPAAVPTANLSADPVGQDVSPSALLSRSRRRSRPCRPCTRCRC